VIARIQTRYCGWGGRFVNMIQNIFGPEGRHEISTKGVRGNEEPDHSFK
jgi:hypothetical protein